MAQDAEPELPETLRRLWRRDVPAGRSGRPGLTVDRVVTAAVELADAHGLEGLSMARVAEQLGFTTMALYRHVASKDELLELMVDAAAGVPPTVPEDLGWRAAIEAWALAQVALFHQHPWVVQVPLQGIPSGPNQVMWIEVGMRALRGSGLPAPERFGLVGTLASYLRQDAVMTRELRALHADRPWPEVEREYGRNLAAVIDPVRFPEVSALLATGVFEAPDSPDGADEVTFGLSFLLDGIEAHAARLRDAGSAPRDL